MSGASLPTRMPFRIRVVLAFLVLTGGVHVVRMQTSTDAPAEITLRARKDVAL